MPEIARHDADDGVAILVHSNPAAQDMRVATELPMPQSIADHDRFGEARLRVAWFVYAPQLGLSAEKLEVIGAGGEHFDTLGVVAPTQRGASRKEGADPLEDAGAIAQVFEFRFRHAYILRARAIQIVKDADQTLRMLERKRPQEHGVHYGEDGDVRADTERQGEYRHRCKARMLPQLASRVANIRSKDLEPANDVHAPIIKTGEGGVQMQK